MVGLAGKFWRSRGGNFTILLTVMLPMFFSAVAIAVDVNTMTRAKTKLQHALDAAMLAASRFNDKELDRKKLFDDYLAANLDGEKMMYNIVGNLEVDAGINYISTKGTASADVDLMFMQMFRRSWKVAVEARAYESRDNLEVVLALDNTGSMGEARMKELRKAATSLIDILTTVHAPDGTPKREVKAALVPFVTAVNVKGTGFKNSWIDWNAASPTHGSNFDPKTNHIDLFAKLGIEWKGCVEARPAPYNLSDNAPSASDPSTLFVPYFAPDEPGLARLPKDSGTDFNNTYLDDVVPSSLSSGTALQKQRNTHKYGNTSTSYIRNGKASTTSGPNYACPTPIVPLTSDFTALKTEIAGMIHWLGSGTNVSEGLAWAMRVLSPGEPYTQGAPFKSENTSKFVVVFTDGENNVFGASNQAINKSDYGSYSFVDQGRIDTNRSAALTKVNTWTLDVCQSLKSQGVEVFTVLLGADTAANRALYSKCATTADNHYYPTSDVSELDAVFKKIASRIARLYVSG